MRGLIERTSPISIFHMKLIFGTGLEALLLFIFMLRVLSVCLYVVLVGVFLIYYGRVAAFLVELLFILRELMMN